MSVLKNIALDKKIFDILEILVVFGLAIFIIEISTMMMENDLVLRQLSVWIANILMLFIIWLGLKLRGENPEKYGLLIGKISPKKIGKALLWSLLVFIIATAAFVVGSIIMANITGIPQKADMSGYAYMQDNVFMFILTLIGVYIVSSFGEEVIYRGYLITRISELELSERANKLITILISTAIFGLVHYEWGVTGIVQTFFMGLALGYFYLKLNRNIWILVLAHIYMDTILMVQMYIGN